MNKFLICVLFSTNFLGCQSDLRQSVINRFGGDTALKNIGELNFTVQRQQLTEKGTAPEIRLYRMNVQEEFLEETRFTNGDTIVQEYRKGKGFEKIGLEVNSLEAKGTSALYQQLYFNFIYLLQADTEWKELMDTTYQDKRVRIVSVKDRTNRAPEIHLFIDTHTFDIVSSSIPENGKYSYYANEFDYKTLPGSTILFPMRFEVVVQGQKILVGTFTFHE